MSSPPLADVTHSRDEVAAALTSIRLVGKGGAARLHGFTDPPETWAAEHAIGLGDRDALLMPTTLIRQLVAEEYAQVTTAYSVFDAEARAWFSVPVRIYWTQKGLERR